MKYTYCIYIYKPCSFRYILFGCTTQTLTRLGRPVAGELARELCWLRAGELGGRSAFRAGCRSRAMFDKILFGSNVFGVGPT